MKGDIMEYKEERITPQMALKYLEKNGVNRRLSNSTIAKYAEDMKNGAWELNGEAICFSKSGVLKDGQHRLMAIVKADVPVNITVCRGVADSTSVYDIGRARSILDSVTIDGYDRELANAEYVAIARLHYVVQKNITTISVYACKTFLNKHEDTLRMLSTIRKKGNKSGITVKNAVFMLPMLYALESGESYEKIEDFANVLSSGFYQSEKQTAAVVLRNDFLLRKIDTRAGGNARVRACMCVENAIHDFCRGKARKKSYSISDTPIYSNNPMFKE